MDVPEDLADGNIISDYITKIRVRNDEDIVINARETQFIYRIYPEALWSQHGVMLLPVINLLRQAKTCHVFGDIYPMGCYLPFVPRRQLNWG